MIRIVLLLGAKMKENDSINQLDDEKLKDAQGGAKYGPSEGYTYNGYNVVDRSWYKACGECKWCSHCGYFEYLPDGQKINGWDGYCTWEKVSDPPTQGYPL